MSAYRRRLRRRCVMSRSGTDRIARDKDALGEIYIANDGSTDGLISAEPEPNHAVMQQHALSQRRAPIVYDPVHRPIEAACGDGWNATQVQSDGSAEYDDADVTWVALPKARSYICVVPPRTLERP